MKSALVSLLAIAVSGAAFAYPDIRRQEIMLPMRDGVKLHTLIHFPKLEDGKKYPAVVDRSPYGYGDMEWITDIFIPFGFVAVGQDMRGTELSEGNFTMWMQDGEDSRDLGDWIVSQEWSDGRIFTFGASADGIGSMQTPRTDPSWLAAQYIGWAPISMYDILFPYGCYKQETAEDWLLGVTMPNPDVVYDNIQTVHENEANAEFWAQIASTPNILAKVHAPSAFWGGWYDLFASGTLKAFDGYNTQVDEKVRYTSVLTMDPLGHCLEGAEFFTENAVEGRTILVIGQLFALYGIIDQVVRPNIKNVTFYVMSSNDEQGKTAGQYWTSLETFPKPTMVDYFLHADHTASLVPSLSLNDKTSYVYDPSNPVPTMGGNNLPPSIGGSIACGPLDQSQVDARSDVLNFETSAFDSELALVGPMFATLYVSSDAVDTDFMVKISDVYPTGEVRLIMDNAVRMRWRNKSPSPEYLTKGKVYEVNMDLWNTSYVIAPGHKLRFSVTSSNWPRFSVNPNNGLLLADPAYPGVNTTATNTLYTSSIHRTKISLPVVLKHQIPEVHVIKEMQAAYPMLTKEYVAAQSKNVDAMLARTRK